MPSTIEAVQNQQANLKGKRKKKCKPSAHFIEHVESIIRGGVHTGNSEHNGECWWIGGS